MSPTARPPRRSARPTTAARVTARDTLRDAAAGLVAAAVLAATSGCGATAGPAADAPPARSAVQAGEVVDTGGARGDEPIVTTHEGRSLSPRTVVAVWAADPAEWAPVRDRAHGTWSSGPGAPVPTSAAVLGPGATEVEPPSAVGLLPAGAPPGAGGTEAERLRRLPGAGEVVVAQVVVHDLVLGVEPVGTTPEAVLAAVAAEGVLADRLGEHTATADGTRAVFGYTGPLLADDEVEAVVEAVAVHAGATPRLEGRGPDPALTVPQTPALPARDGAPDAAGHGH